MKSNTFHGSSPVSFQKFPFKTGYSEKALFPKTFIALVYNILHLIMFFVFTNCTFIFRIRATHSFWNNIMIFKTI